MMHTTLVKPLYIIPPRTRPKNTFVPLLFNFRNFPNIIPRSAKTLFWSKNQPFGPINFLSPFFKPINFPTPLLDTINFRPIKVRIQ